MASGLYWVAYRSQFARRVPQMASIERPLSGSPARRVWHSKTSRIAAHLFIAILAYHAVHLLRTRLAAHDLHDRWSTILRSATSSPAGCVSPPPSARSTETASSSVRMPNPTPRRAPSRRRPGSQWIPTGAARRSRECSDECTNVVPKSQVGQENTPSSQLLRPLSHGKMAKMGGEEGAADARSPLSRVSTLR